MSEREEKFEAMLRAVQREYDDIIQKMEKLKCILFLSNGSLHIIKFIIIHIPHIIVWSYFLSILSYIL